MTNEELEQNQIFLDGERMRRLKESEDWKWAKEKLDFLMDAVTSIGTLPKNVTATTLQKEIDARNKAIGIVRAWFEEVEGTGVQQQFNKEKKTINNELITRFGENNE